MKRVAILGGGISGLSAAFYLEQARKNDAEIEYTLFESASRLGGVLKTDCIRECIIEAGPDSFLTAKPWATELAKEVGLADQLIYSNDSQRKTFILDNGRLITLPDGIQMVVPTRAWPIASSTLLSFGTKFRMLREYFAPPERLPDGQDESVGSFVERHFGEEVVSKLASPLLAGIYGGDAAQLSARAVLPHFVAIEAKHRSLVRGVLHSLANANASGIPAPLFTSFKQGMQQLVDAVASQIRPESVRLNCPVSAIAQYPGGWSVTAGEQSEKFSDLIIALPAHAAAKLLQPQHAELARTLESIRYASSITVALVYAKKKLPNLPPGFGFLVPRSEGRGLIACTFVRNKFNHRAPDNYVLLRAFLTDGCEKPDSELQAVVEQELAEILGINTSPEFVSISRWPRAMAQYEVGHLDRLAAIERMVGDIPHLQLIGNAYRGIGIPDCVREGKQAAARVVNSQQSAVSGE